jgi:hypothetical protein
MTTARRPTQFRFRQATGALFAACVLLVHIGCAARNSVPQTTSGTYAGPPLSLVHEDDATHILFSAPSPGWTVTLDQVVDAFKRRDAFVTIRLPNPEYAYAQVVVEQRVATTIPPDLTARLFVRFLKHDSKATFEDAYRLAHSLDPVTAPAKP